ncbi:hypothetical protein BCR37DRAFT_379992 [Protomyces lactucae-debilis]|uniref:Uncharacterized protein n=1 Tax=Protomyces lactucae-debilis TaxID=2754530 RepID=A0A1Y2FDS2_PROLT|nr:uncharacterized protein BCR37DRAFT_379992 [Protomyces lactucae-debilis]ORY82068.1 hypothetical protein BCR37DRAFT_379992 [Protomyces lactucae-debilis]
MGTFDSPKVEASRPSTTEMLQFLLDNVLIVPEGFLKALGPLSYPLRQKVLHNERTKAWVQAMSDAGALCQRIIRGRHHATRSSQEEVSETTLVRQTIARWTTLLPRLKSLSAGQHADLRPLEDVKMKDLDDAEKRCSICLTGISKSETHAACFGLQRQMALSQSR